VGAGGVTPADERYMQALATAWNLAPHIGPEQSALDDLLAAAGERLAVDAQDFTDAACELLEQEGLL